MLDSTKPYTFDRVVRMVLTAVFLAAAFFLLRYLSDVLLPFAAAAVLAYFLNPVVIQFERRTKRRGFAVAFTLIGLIVVGFALVVILVPLFVHQVRRFEEDLHKLKGDLSASWTLPAVDGEPLDAGSPSPVDTSPPINAPLATQPAGELNTWGLIELKQAWDQYIDDAGKRPRSVRLRRLRQGVSGTAIGTLIEQAVDYVKTAEFRTLMIELLRRIAVGGVTVINFAAQLFIAATVVLVILLYLVFLLLDFPRYQKTWKSFIPPAYRDPLLGFLAEFDEVLRRYFRGQFVIAALTGILFAVAFSIIGLPMAVPFGLFVGVLNMVPYLQMVALVPAALLAILRSIDTDTSLLASFAWVAVVFIVVQVIQDAFLTPRIMGRATGLSPVAILLGLFIWAKLLGFLGLLLAIPLTCVGIAYYRRFVLELSTDNLSPTLKNPP